MSDEKKQVAEALSRAAKDTKMELANSPNEELGCCTISSRGWSEQKPDITKAACDRQKGPGVTVNWKKGSC